ncbi:hypothetical protein [Variovorax sp. dw_308]|uniref:hypothetical protein n=1 Tax=Variovorax sp. dw_308 TaxID=2721546 RepID=UPI001C45C81E|nr:hypothetical protein [Variovorax sp. dw_308]
MFSQINLPACMMQAFALALVLWVAMPAAQAQSSPARAFVVELHQQHRSDGGTIPWSYKRVANADALRAMFPGLKSLQIQGQILPTAGDLRVPSAFTGRQASL